ncbi:MAG: hypothetical protein WAL36_23475 [Pseudolabrys sp.]
MIVILVASHLTHVLEHGGRKRRHAHALGTPCASTGCGALALKVISMTPKTKCLEALEATEGLVRIGVVPTV